MTTVTGACCQHTGAYAFDRAIMPGEAGPEQTTVIGARSDLMQSVRDLRSVDPPQRTKRPAQRELLALCFKELLKSTFGGHLSSTSMFGPAQRTLSRIAEF